MALDEYVPEGQDGLLKEVARFLVTKRIVSIGAVQSRFRISFRRADSIMFELGQMGIIPKNYLATNPGEPLMTEEELKEWMRESTDLE